MFCLKNAILTSADHILVAVSGGPDSVCLLHVLQTVAPELELKLTVAHLNHHLRGPAADADANFVCDLARAWGWPAIIATEDVPGLAAEHNLSLEEAARQVRYTFLGRTAAQVGATKIAVGHNADDQAETVLMHFLRGTGLTGLRGMRPMVRLDRLLLNPMTQRDQLDVSGPILIRPLLETSRADIETYCQANHLPTRQDASNQDTRFFRNRLRHELLPHLESYNPNIRQALQRTAKIVAADLELLTTQQEQAWLQVVRQAKPQHLICDLENWRALPLALKRSLLRRAMHHLTGSKQRDLGFESIEAALTLIETGPTGRQATLPHGLRLRLGYETFTIAPHTALAALQPLDEPLLLTKQPVPVTIPGSTPLPQTTWHLHTKIVERRDIAEERIIETHRWAAYFDADVTGSTLTLRSRQQGDLFWPLGLKGHRKKVKTFMIDEKIPADRRHTIPLLTTNQQIVWVCGYRPDERACLTSATKRVLHAWFEKHPETTRQ